MDLLQFLGSHARVAFQYFAYNFKPHLNPNKALQWPIVEIGGDALAFRFPRVYRFPARHLSLQRCRFQAILKIFLLQRNDDHRRAAHQKRRRKNNRVGRTEDKQEAAGDHHHNHHFPRCVFQSRGHQNVQIKKARQPDIVGRLHVAAQQEENHIHQQTQLAESGFFKRLQENRSGRVGEIDAPKQWGDSGYASRRGPQRG